MVGGGQPDQDDSGGLEGRPYDAFLHQLKRVGIVPKKHILNNKVSKTWRTTSETHTGSTIHAQYHPPITKGHLARTPKPIQPKQPGQRHGGTSWHCWQLTHTGHVDQCNHGRIRDHKGKTSYAKSILASTNKTVLPTITAQAEAQVEANQLNVINQAVIGAKEGAVETITKLAGSNIINAILRTPDGSNHKGIDDFGFSM